MRDWQPIEPWDDAKMAEALLELIVTLPRTRLDQLDPPKVPGAYVQFIRASELDRRRVEVLGPALDGSIPIYCGVAERSIRERVNRYRRAISGVSAFNETNIYFLLVPCRSGSSARFAEAALIERLDPVLQGFGHGARSQKGRSRSSQAASAIDALFAGRPHAPVADPAATAAAYARVVANLASRKASAPRWPPIRAPADGHNSRFTYIERFWVGTSTGSVVCGFSLGDSPDFSFQCHH